MKTDEKYTDSMKQEIEGLLSQLAPSLAFEAKQLIKNTFLKMEKDKSFPREALGCTPEMMEVIYSHGYQLFYVGKYQEALSVFLMLQQFDPMNARYSFSIAACYHRKKDYLKAATHYLLSHSLNQSDPLPCFYLYDCFMKINAPLSALGAIESALTLTEKETKFQDLRTKIELESLYLNEFLKNYSYKKDA